MRKPLLTVSLWGTLLHWRCHPDEVAQFTMNHLLVKHRRALLPAFRTLKAMLAEREASMQYVGRASPGVADLRSVFLDMLQRVMTSPGRGNVELLATTLVDVEAGHVLDESILNREALRWLPRGGKDIVAIAADFHLGVQYIAPMLRHLCPQVEWNHIFLSCDHNTTKVSGGLFKLIHRVLGVEPRQHTHIGHDIVGDYEAPKRLGINARLVATSDACPARIRYPAGVVAPRRYLEVLEERLVSIRASGPTARERVLFDAGKAVGVLLASFVLSAVRRAVSLGVPRVHYLAREGVLFARMHAGLKARHLFGVTPPEGIVLHVSRCTTFPASLRGACRQSIAPYLERYGQISPRVLLVASMGLPEEIARAIVDDAGIDFERPIAPSAAASWDQLFASNRARRVLNEHTSRRRGELLEYLNGLCIREGERVMIVDLGGQGTMQDHLSQVLPTSHVSGCYLLCTPDCRRHAWSSRRKYAYMVRRLRIPGAGMLLEQICGAPYGTALGYNAAGDVIRSEVPQVEADYWRYYKWVQDGVLAATTEVFELLASYAVPTSAWPDVAAEPMYRWIASPPMELARLYYDSLFCDEFLGRQYYRRNDVSRVSTPWWLSWACVGSKRQRNRTLERLRQMAWPQGLLTYKRQYLLRSMFNRRFYADALS